MPADDSKFDPDPGRDSKRAGRLARAAARPAHGAAYEGAMEAVFAILIAVGLGYWADEYFETGPRYLIVGAILGFAAFVLRLLRMGELVEAAAETENAPETSAQRSVASRSGEEDRIIRGTDRRPSGDEGRAD